MISLALVTKNKPSYIFDNFNNLVMKSDEFDPYFSKSEYDYNPKIFNIEPIYRDEDLKGLYGSKNYTKICDDLYIDQRTIPNYIVTWEKKKIENILITYLGIAIENLKLAHY